MSDLQILLQAERRLYELTLLVERALLRRNKEEAKRLSKQANEQEAIMRRADRALRKESDGQE